VAGNKINKFDWFSLIPHILTVFGLIVTVSVFFNEQKALRQLEQRNTIMLMQRQGLTEHKQEFYKLAESIGSLSAVLYTNNQNSQQKAIEAFYKNYFGQAFLISDAEMIRALNFLHLDLKNFQEGKISLVGNASPKVRVIRSVDKVLRVMKKSIESKVEEIQILDRKLLGK